MRGKLFVTLASGTVVCADDIASIAPVGDTGCMIQFSGGGSVSQDNMTVEAVSQLISMARRNTRPGLFSGASFYA